MNDELPIPPHQPNGTLAQGFLRFFIWLTPCGAAFASIAAGGYFNNNPTIITTVLVMFTFGAGMFDGLFTKKVPKVDGKPLLPQLLLHALTFTLTQIVLVPSILVGILFAACSLSGY